MFVVVRGSTFWVVITEARSFETGLITFVSLESGPKVARFFFFPSIILLYMYLLYVRIVTYDKKLADVELTALSNRF